MAYVTIKDDELIYDRTKNFSGVGDFIEINEISCPTEGSNVEFLAKDKALTTNNNYLNIMPVGINNLYANFNMVYETTEEDARILANFLESKRGIEPVFFDSDPTLYRKINGYCTEYSINQVDVKTFRVGARFEITESPGAFNWTGLNFLDPQMDNIYYQQNNKEYLKNDIAFDQRLEVKYTDRINNFYYCTEDHDASEDVSENLEESPYWTRDFFWEPDVGQQNTVKIDVQRFGDSDGFPLRRKVKDNIASFPITYNFTKIDTKQLRAMLHFLESHGGYRRFKHRISAVYNRPKVYVSRKWTHTWNSFDSHDLQVVLDEDPLGIVPDRVPQNQETLSTRAFDAEGDLFKQIDGDIPSGWADMEPEIFGVRIGASCSVIGEGAFAYSSNIQGRLSIPGSVTKIEKDAFRECVGLNAELFLGGSVEEIGEYAFYNNSLMEGRLRLSPNTKFVGDYAFLNCSNFNSEFSLGTVLSGIGTGAFENCSLVKDRLVIPPTLTTVSQAAFRGMENLYGDLNIPSGVEYIESQAFWGCKRLGTEVRLPSTIKQLGNNAFYGCDSVYDVYIYAPVAPTILVGEDPFPTANMPKLRHIHIPLGGDGYSAQYWQDKKAEDKIKYDIIL